MLLSRLFCQVTILPKSACRCFGPFKKETVLLWAHVGPCRGGLMAPGIWSNGARKTATGANVGPTCGEVLSPSNFRTVRRDEGRYLLFDIVDMFNPWPFGPESRLMWPKGSGFVLFSGFETGQSPQPFFLRRGIKRPRYAGSYRGLVSMLAQDKESLKRIADTLRVRTRMIWIMVNCPRDFILWNVKQEVE